MPEAYHMLKAYHMLEVYDMLEDYDMLEGTKTNKTFRVDRPHGAQLSVTQGL